MAYKRNIMYFLTKSLARRALVALALLGGLMAGAGSAHALSEIAVKAPYAILMDAETGSVLFAKNADTLMAPASMTKIVTLGVLFDQIRQGLIRPDDEIRVSVDAWRRGGAASGSSTMFLEPESSVSVENLIRGIVVHSGNDAAIAIAERIAGSEPAFALMMNQYASKLGIERSTFVNATGWPEAGHQSTARDLAVIARDQIQNYPDFYRFYEERRFSWNGIAQSNRNDLLDDGIGVDGLKTGHTSASGYGIVVSAIQRGRRLILVLNGMESEREREREARRLLTWGFRAFSAYHLLHAGDVVDSLAVWHGVRSNVAVRPARDIKLTMTAQRRRGISVEMHYEVPTPAPVREGDELGALRVRDEDGVLLEEVPLVATGDVARRGFLGRAMGTLQHMIFGG